MKHEQAVIRDVLDALLREDHLGLSSRGRPDGTGRWLVPDLPAAPGVALSLPVRADGFLADRAVAAPHADLGGTRLDRLPALLDVLAPRDDPEAEAGWAAFVAECDGELAARRAAATAYPALRRRLDATGLPTGLAGAVYADALAAHAGHPVHPTSRYRHGLTAADLRAYAPEFAPRFPLRWAALPAASVTWQGTLPSWWPRPADVGLSGGDEVLLPLHPLTAVDGVRLVPGAHLGGVDSVRLAPRAHLGGVGGVPLAHLDVAPPAAIDGVRLAPRGYLDVSPTLSMRTVAVLADTSVHLKLPLPTATLGARNRRTIAPGTLADGATVQRLLQRIAAAEPRFTGRILHADETTYGHTADDRLAVLVRRYPAGLDDALVVPVAALAVDGVLDRLPGDTLGAYLDLLVDWHVALWLRYGIALEAHQQNVALVLRPGEPLSLLYKDNDGARIDLSRLPAPSFADARIGVTDPGELADMFVTITLHLCAAAPLLALRRRGVPAPAPGPALRPRLLAALRRWTDPADPASLAASDLLRARVLDADRLPIKAMVTAGTLLPKHRLGCPDINKYYLRTGPNYLRTAPGEPAAR